MEKRTWPTVSCTEPQQNVSVADRIGNSEGLLTSFVAEHSLPFTMSQPIIDLAKELAKDPKALDSFSMQRTMCAYKLVDGLNEVIHKRIATDLRNTPFSINTGVYKYQQRTNLQSPSFVL